MNVIIIGGGIAGISAAIRLKQAGIDSTILDKGRKVGGRISTKSVELENGKVAKFDYGAPHFAVKTESWEEVVMYMVSHFKVSISSRDAYYPPNTTYRGTSGMNDILQFLSEGITYKNSKKVVFLNPHGKLSEVITADGESFYGDAVILTTPIPQTLELFKNSQINIPYKLQKNLSNLKYSKMFMAMLAIDGTTKIPDSGFLAVNQKGIKYIVDNKKRGISKVPALTIATDERFAEERFDDDREKVLDEIIEIASEYFSGDILHKQIHGWKYAFPLTEYKKAFEYINAPTPFVLAGDAFLDLSVEGAFLSGKTAAEFLIGHKENLHGNLAIESVKG